MKRMLINATQQEELRVALVEGQYLYDLDIESPGHEQKKANIYKGTITKINPSLEAAFVSYGGERDGFLSLKEIADTYFPSNISGRKSIKHLQEGQEVLVQIEKEIRGKKGAALTTYISLAGSYLVLMPNDPKAGGVSRRIEGEDRADLKRIIDSLEKPKGMGVIARTAGVGKSQEELQQDLNALLTYWDAIQTEAKNHPAPILIHKESDIITRAFRDYLRDDVGEILIDNKNILEIAKKRLVGLGRTEYLNRLKLYSGDVPLFSRLQIETQIESAFQREVRLPSGGSIVIDTTEALTAIDINSAKSIRGSDIEETAFTTNLEAAEEIARQLRLRDLGGLIVIDFIDMTPIRNQREVENRLKEAMKNDRARIQTTRISRFGLLEMSRQRLSPSLREATHHICPRCSGTGTVRDNNSLSLSILRLINEEALKENTGQIDVIVPIPIASYLLNEKRRAIAKIELENPGLKIVIAADEEMETPQYRVIRKRRGEEIDILSYNLPKLIREQEEEDEEAQPEIVVEEAILSGVTVDLNPVITKAPKEKVVAKTTNEKKGLFSSLVSGVRNLFKSSEVPNDNDKNTSKSNEKPPRVERKRTNNRRPRNNNSNSNNTNNSNSTVVAAPVNNTEAPKENKNTRRTRNSNNRPQANTNNEIVKNEQPNSTVEKAKVVAESKAAPTEKREPKPRRAQRNLAKSVRIVDGNPVENTVTEATAAINTQNQTPEMVKPVKSVAPIAAETKAHNSVHAAADVSTEKTATNDAPTAEYNNEVRRSRRTPRHLRMNGQRRKRLKDSANTESPMPLTLAVASVEFALGRVCIDYTLLNAEKALKAAAYAENEDVVEAASVIPSVNHVAIAESLTDDHAVNNVADIAATHAEVTESKTSAEHKVVTEIKQIVAETIEAVVEMTESIISDEPVVQIQDGTKPEQTESKLNESKADSAEKHVLPVAQVKEEAKRHASASMTKAPAPEMATPTTAVTVTAISLVRPDYQFTGKGHAGGHSADSHAFSAMSKPKQSEHYQQEKSE